MHKTISMSDLMTDMVRVVNEIETLGTMYRIRRPGKKRLIRVDRHYLERLKATIEYVTAHPNWEEEIAQTDRDLAAGLCPTLDEVLRMRRDYAAIQPKRRARPRGNSRSSRAKAGPRDSNGVARTTKRNSTRRR